MRETEAVEQQLNVTPASCNELRVFVDDLLSAYAFVRLDAVARARVCPAAGKFSVVARAADKPFGADVTHRATYVEHVGRCVVVGIPQPMQFPRGLEKRNEMHERIRSQENGSAFIPFPVCLILCMLGFLCCNPWLFLCGLFWVMHIGDCKRPMI